MPEPMMITNKESLDELKLYFSRYDFLEALLKVCPDTKFRPLFKTNVCYHVYKTAYNLTN